MFLNYDEVMSRSRKKNPGGTNVGCKSQHWGKKAASRRFRRIVKMCMLHNSDVLPAKSIEVTNTYDLGGDGKQYWQDHDEDYMRK